MNSGFLDTGRPPFWWTMVGALVAGLVLALALTYVVVREPEPRAAGTAVAPPPPSFTPETASSAPAPSAVPTSRGPDLDRALAGTWVGSYRCRQGRTGITIVITPVVNGRFRATSKFYAVPDNPGVPSGETVMVGVRSATTVMLAGERWITRPSGWTWVDMVFELSEPAPRHLEGRMADEECGAIVLDKQNDDWTDPPV
ncbi:hypothetical protein Val02_10790 [Virgisporangium aliadipatigenens]|uniref:Uncharacterized protein n=1 Tax=Virgisporangium aliadipatigenens TaxID=741659 RepID=A0A8J3YHA7_9ACTN|nr:hypothetical protein [Virgisporangium aliadipatigenens]GIJ44193.1 hypothetical protein Val02_10790 [Virgisporangium aliadipatigenens]